MSLDNIITGLFIQLFAGDAMVDILYLQEQARADAGQQNQAEQNVTLSRDHPLPLRVVIPMLQYFPSSG